ncbi:DoxX family protein [soil metagenome]
MFARLERYSPYALAALRIIAALLFIEHGLMKLIHFPAAQPGMDGPLPPLLLVASLLEIIGGSFVALGVFTRPSAFVLSGMMAVAYFMAHFPKGFWPALNGGDAAILFCFIFFYISTAGPGALSLDGVLKRR